MKERLVSRVTTDYFLKYADLIAQRFNGNFLRGFIFLAVVQGSIEHIDHASETSLAYAGLDTAPPNSLRRPVPINSISASLGLPYETVRRHIQALISSGHCVKVRGKGVIVPAHVLESPEYQETLKRCYDYLCSMISVLHRAGVVVDKDGIISTD